MTQGFKNQMYLVKVVETGGGRSVAGRRRMRAVGTANPVLISLADGGASGTVTNEI